MKKGISLQRKVYDLLLLGVFSTFFGMFGGFMYLSLTSNSSILEEKIVLHQTVPEIVEKSISSVVAIEILKEEEINFGFPLSEIPNVIPNETNGEKKPLVQVGGGSGFLIDSGGLIVTNKHVVQDAAAVIRVRLFNGKEYSAKVVAKDPILDLAFISIEEQGLPFLEFADSDNIRIGDAVIAIGYSLAEYGNSVTTGIVSGLGRRVEAGSGYGATEILREAIQTDAAINLGNSGGPLLNSNGKVIGINTAVSTKGQSIGFAIPANRMKKSVQSVQKYGEILRPRLGVRYMPITPRLQMERELPTNYGVLIVNGMNNEPGVVPDSPASKAGFEVGDILLFIDDIRLDEKDTLSVQIAQKNIGDTVRCTVLRDGKEIIIEATLDAFPSNN